jgi:asparagine synthase (glutamine-hydrolysing)
VPLLDHRIVEFANALAPEDKVGPRSGKLIMRRILARYVPEALVERPKRGFSVPVGGWLRGPLRAWASDLVEDSHAARAGLFDGAVARRMFRDHLDWRRDWASTLWCVLMFEAWYRRRHAR